MCNIFISCIEDFTASRYHDLMDNGSIQFLKENLEKHKSVIHGNESTCTHQPDANFLAAIGIVKFCLFEIAENFIEILNEPYNKIFLLLKDFFDGLNEEPKKYFLKCIYRVHGLSKLMEINENENLDWLVPSGYAAENTYPNVFLVYDDISYTKFRQHLDSSEIPRKYVLSCPHFHSSLRNFESTKSNEYHFKNHIPSLLLHTTVALELNKNVITEPFSEAFKNPNILRGLFLPSMPLIFKRDKNQAWNDIGENPQKGYLLRNVENSNGKESAERMTLLQSSIMRVVLHLVLYSIEIFNNGFIEKLISNQGSSNNSEEFLLNHIHTDILNIAKILRRSCEAVSILLHKILSMFCIQNEIRDSLKWTDLKNLYRWEQMFIKFVVCRSLKNLENVEKKIFNDKLLLEKNKLYFQNLLETQDNDENTPLLRCSIAWKIKESIGLESTILTLNNVMELTPKMEFLHHALTNIKVICVIKHLPDLVCFSNSIIKNIQGKYSKSQLRRETIERYIEKFYTKGKESMKMIVLEIFTLQYSQKFFLLQMLKRKILLTICSCF